LVPEHEVTSVDISVEEAMKLIVSGGLCAPSTSLASAVTTAATATKWSGAVKQPETGVPIG
jgi:uncharacterized membrane protein